MVFDKLWRSLAPLKGVTLSSKLFLDRLPTRQNLGIMNALSSGVSSIADAMLGDFWYL